VNRMQGKTALVIGAAGEIGVRRVVATSSAEVYGGLPGTSPFGLAGSTQSPNHQHANPARRLNQKITDVTNAEKLFGSVAATSFEVGTGHQIEFQRAQMETTP
jgi:nucleoside-diphosphate-sugar epimerase